MIKKKARDGLWGRWLLSEEFKGFYFSQFTCLGGALFVLFFRQASSNLPAFFSAYIVFAFALLFSLVSGFTKLFEISRNHCTVKNITLLVLVGIASFIGNASFVITLKHLLPGSAHLLQRSETVWTILLGVIFFREKGFKVLLISTLLFLGGIWILHYHFQISKEYSQGFQGDIAPFFYGSISAFSFAVMQVIIKVLLKDFSVYLINLVRLIFLMMLLTMIFPSYLFELMDLSYYNLALFALAALVGPFIGRLCYMKAADYSGVAKAALFTSLSPVYTIFLQMIFLNQFISGWQWLGSLFLLAAVSFPGVHYLLKKN